MLTFLTEKILVLEVFAELLEDLTHAVQRR